MNEHERQVVEAINAARLGQGLAALRPDERLTAAARRHAADMSRNPTIVHVGSDGSDGGQRMRDAGYNWQQWGEVVGWGFDGNVGRMVDWWLSSPGHRPHLLDGSMTDVGVAYVNAPESRWGHYWVADFGVGDVRIAYSVLLPIVIGSGKTPYDMRRYILGDPARVFRCDNSHGSAQFHQTQEGAEPGVFYQVKNQEWEEFKVDDTHIYRGMDISMGGGRFYTLRDELEGRWSRWCPRYWSPGGLYERNPLVTVYRPDCSIELGPTRHPTWLRFTAHLASWVKERPSGDGSRVPVGLRVANVAVLHWLAKPDATTPLETYYYAEGYGLVGFGDGTVPNGFESWIAHEFEPGQRQPESRLPRPCGV